MDKVELAMAHGKELHTIFAKEVTFYADQLLEWCAPGSSKWTLTKDWPLADPVDAISIVVAYLAFVLFGSAFMSCKKSPVDVKFLKYMYNPLQVRRQE